MNRFLLVIGICIFFLLYIFYILQKHRTKGSVKFLLSGELFYDVCLLFIFWFLSFCYGLKLIDVSQYQSAFIGLGVLVLTISDLINNMSKINVSGRILYIVGLGIILVTPYIRMNDLEKMNIDSTLITLLGLLMIFFSSIINKINNKKDEILNAKKIEEIELLISNIKDIGIKENNIELLKQIKELQQEDN